MGTQTIQQLLAPVVLISACGLLCLALYNRLATIVARIRQFNRERVDELLRMRGAPETVRRTLERHREGLEAQVPGMLRRARLIHLALQCFAWTIAILLVSSLLIGVSMLLPPAQWVALGVFVAGVVCMLTGVGCAIAELHQSLAQVEFEHELVDRIQDEE